MRSKEEQYVRTFLILFAFQISLYRVFGGTDKDYELKLCKKTIDHCNKRFEMDGYTYMKEHMDDVIVIRDNLLAEMRIKRKRY